jgi:2-phospho-L-lactate transferase/gluconeogenesis factor (CofD/UPF0052 family)
MITKVITMLVITSVWAGVAIPSLTETSRKIAQANFTPQQQQIQAVLTLQQSTQISQAIANGQTFDDALKSVELTPDQKAKIDQIMDQSNRKKLKIIPLQRQSL